MKPFALLLALALPASADSIKLRDGTVVEGQFLGASQSEIFFHRTGRSDFLGRLVIPIGQVESLAFSAPPSSVSASAKAPKSLLGYLTTIFATAWLSNSSVTRTATVASVPAGRSTRNR